MEAMMIKPDDILRFWFPGNGHFVQIRTVWEKTFSILPLAHSELLAMHEKMVALSEPMIAEAPEPAIQTQIVTECLHDAGLPAGVFNIVNGRGDVAGAELTGHPDVAKISFTGSTVTGKAILSASAETMKRVTLELGGKSPTLILDDADLTEAVPIAVGAGFLNSGQACGAGTRILVPADRLAEVATIAQEVVARMKVGDPREPDTQIGPMVSQNQWERVQRYIRLGIEEGAAVLIGGQRPSVRPGGRLLRKAYRLHERDQRYRSGRKSGSG
jgi:acyl-CoA reductase-like NAD-dependent aldehyde dehydrogenase